MPLAHHVLGQTDVGMERKHNEDAHDAVALERGWLLLVCDGMGGHEAGEVASAVALDCLRDALKSADLAAPGEALREALLDANEAVLDASDENGHGGMGTTAVVGLVLDDQIWFGWVGDSRIYLFRRGQLAERSVDHTHVQRLVDAGVLTEEEARHHPDGNVLVQALGGGRGNQLDLQPGVMGPFTLEQGDVVLLCSDGLYDLIDDEELYPLIAGRSLADAVEELVREANRRGGHDNITALVLIAGQDRVDELPEGFQHQRHIRRAAEPVALADERDASTWRERVARYVIPLLCGLGAGLAASYWLKSS